MNKRIKHNYIASYGISNSSAIGIIDCNDDLVAWDLLSGDKVIESGTSEVEYIKTDKEAITELTFKGVDYTPIFRVGEFEISLNECMRI